MFSCCLNSSAYEKWGFPAQTFKFLTLKTFLKYTCHRQIAFLLLLCKQGNVFNLFFYGTIEEEKTLIEINLICFSSSYSYSNKKVGILQRNILNTLYIQE